MADRYEPRPDPKQPGLWVVRDVRDERNLMGWYTEAGATTTAKRMNANISLSPNQMRAFAYLLSVETTSAHKLYEQFKGRLWVYDRTTEGLKIAKVWLDYELVTIDGPTVSATDWAYIWASRKRPQ